VDFTQYGSTQVLAGVNLSDMHVSSAPLDISGLIGGAVQTWDGRIYRVKATVGGVTAFDFHPHADATDGATAWTGGDGLEWELSGPSGATVDIKTIPGSTRASCTLVWTGTQVIVEQYSEF
jgi:hypothetical protein